MTLLAASNHELLVFENKKLGEEVRRLTVLIEILKKEIEHKNLDIEHAHWRIDELELELHDTKQRADFIDRKSDELISIALSVIEDK